MTLFNMSADVSAIKQCHNTLTTVQSIWIHHGSFQSMLLSRH